MDDPVSVYRLLVAMGELALKIVPKKGQKAPEGFGALPSSVPASEARTAIEEALRGLVSLDPDVEEIWNAIEKGEELLGPKDPQVRSAKALLAALEQHLDSDDADARPWVAPLALRQRRSTGGGGRKLPGKKAAKRPAKKAFKKAAKRPAKKAFKKTAKKSLKKAAKKSLKKATKKTARRSAARKAGRR